jgi:hypothetical protein
MNLLKQQFQLLKKDPPAQMKTIIKNRLFSRINNQPFQSKELTQKFSEEKQSVSYLKTIGKARLFQRIHNYHPAPLGTVLCFLFRRKNIAGFTISLLLFSILSFVLTPPFTINAQSITYLKPETGIVKIKHLWQPDFSLVSTNLALNVGDTIFTEEASQATIVFFDNSLVRLQPNTELTILKLDQHPYVKKTGIVDFKLTKGHIWNKVVQIQDDFSKFIVETKNGIISTNQAAFTVSSEQEEVEVKTIDRSVNLEILSNQKIISKTRINEGFNATIKNPSTPHPTIADIAVIEPLDVQVRNEDWVQDNMKKDAVHIEYITAQAIATLEQEAPAEEPALIAKLNPIFTIQEKSDSTATLLNEANQKFETAIMLLKEGNSAEAEQQLSAYKQAVEVLLTDSSDPQFHAQVQGDISSKQQQLLTITPESELFLVKEMILELKESIAEEKNKQKIILANATDTLHTVYDLLEKNQGALAKEQFQRYQEKIQALISDLQQPEKQEITGAQLALVQDNLPLLEQVVEQLTATEQKLLAHISGQNLADFQIEPIQKSPQFIFSVADNNPSLLSFSAVPNQKMRATMEEVKLLAQQQEEALKEEIRKQEAEEKKMARRQELAEKKAAEILGKINIYNSYPGQYNKLLGEIKALDSIRYRHYKQQVLAEILNKAPIELRHKIKAEMND